MKKEKKIKIFLGTTYLVIIATFLWVFFSNFSLDEVSNYNFIKNNNNYRIEMDFDFPAWLAKSDSPLNEFKKQSAYELNYNIEKIQNIRNEIKTVQGDQERALGRYLDRRQMIGFDLFEKQFTKLM